MSAAIASRKAQAWVAVALVPLLFAAIYPLQRAIDTRRQTVQSEKDELLVRSGKLVKKLSLGYDGLMADIYWTRAVQYYGGNVRDHDPDFQLLSPLLDVATTLDPQLLVAYKFGAVFLAEVPPRGAGRPDLAVQLVKKGIANNPDQWRLYQDLGFIYYNEMRDYQKAAEAYLQGSKLPGARDWMKVMAARIAAEGGSRQISMALWADIYDSSRDPNIRKNAVEHLQALKAEQDMEQIAHLVELFTQQNGASPRSLDDLVSARLIRALPLDAEGAPYVLDAEGRVRLNPSSKVNLDILRAIK